MHKRLSTQPPSTLTPAPDHRLALGKDPEPTTTFTSEETMERKGFVKDSKGEWYPAMW